MALQKVVVVNQPASKRVMRRPRHPFFVKHMPFALTPFLCAPVLPNETMQNLRMQSRGVSKTMVNALVGAWLEYYFFYVKFSDFATTFGDAVKDMLINPARVMTDIDSTTADSIQGRKAVTIPGGNATQLPWVSECLTAVINNYFRDGDETIATSGAAITNVNGFSEFLSHAQGQSDFLQSAIEAAHIALEDVDVDLDADSTITAAEVNAALAQWAIAKAGGFTDITFEQYLETQGVRGAVARQNVPELLRHWSDYSYPVNTVDPTDGDPSTAFSWGPTVTADKHRFFKEPGFILGLTVFRPKIYKSKQEALAINFLNTVYDWLPNAIMTDSDLSMKTFNGVTTNTTESDGPFDIITDDYKYDVRDLYLYGEQYVNLPKADTDYAGVDIPSATLKTHYTTKAQMDTLFQGAESDEAFSQDGIVSLQILGQQTDLTPGTGQQ